MQILITGGVKVPQPIINYNRKTPEHLGFKDTRYKTNNNHIKTYIFIFFLLQKKENVHKTASTASEKG